MKNALEILNRMKAEGRIEHSDYSMLFDAICSMNTVKQDGWTSVKEQLPKKDGEYLVWIQYDFAEFPQYGIVPFDSCAGAFGEFVERFDKSTLGYMGEEFHEQKGVLAWMPLPELPKEETA